MLTSFLDQLDAPEDHTQLVRQEDGGDHGEQEVQAEQVKNICGIESILKHPVIAASTVVCERKTI